MATPKKPSTAGKTPKPASVHPPKASTAGTTKKVAAAHAAKGSTAAVASKAKGVPAKAGKSNAATSAKLDLAGSINYRTKKTVKAVVAKGLKKGEAC